MGFVGPLDGRRDLCVHILFKTRHIFPSFMKHAFSSVGREMILRSFRLLLALILKHPQTPTDYSTTFTFCIFWPEHHLIKKNSIFKYTSVPDYKSSIFPFRKCKEGKLLRVSEIHRWLRYWQKIPQQGLLIDHFALWKTGFLFSFLWTLGLDNVCACVCTCDISSGVIIMFSSPVFPRFLLPRRLARWQQMELLFTSCAYDPTEIRWEMNVESALSVGRPECLGSRHSRAGEAPEMAELLPVSWQMLILH